MKSVNALSNGKKTIAVLAGSFSSTYLEGISRGAHEAASQLGYNLVVYAGGPLKSPDNFALSRDNIFDLVDTKLIDGIIIPVSSHTRFLNEIETNNFIDRYRNIPMVNIGSYIPGVINVLTDYRKGIQELFHHLTIDHNYKRVAFIRGPKNHISSNIREQIYKQELKKHGLPFDKSLVFNSSLNRFKSRNLAKMFIDANGKPICDAIITLNDNQALGIMEGLKDKGLEIPKDIAVCGSSNVLAGLFSEPELTSIKEPKFELGEAAVYALDRVFKGATPEDTINISTSLVIRKSCGCTPKIENLRDLDENITTGNLLKTESERIFKRISQITNNIHHIYKSNSNKDELDIILEQFKKTLLTESTDKFYELLKGILEKTIKSEDIITWLGIVTEIQKELFDFTTYHEEKSGLVKLNRDLTLLRNVVEQKAIKFQNYDTDYYIDHFREIINNLNSSFDINAVRKYAMDILDLNEFHISVYNKTKGKISSATNFLTVRDRKKIEIPKTALTFTQSKLLPEGAPTFINRYTLLVFPLSFRKKPLGFLIVDLSKRKGTAYENMQAIISTALKNELQIQELRHAEERFSDIAHSTSNWLWETDKNNTFTYSSISVNEVIGYNAEEITGRDLNSLSISDTSTHIQRMKAHEKISNLECWFKHKNGKLVCLIISAAPSFKNKEFNGYRGVFIDITEQKLQEEKIHSLAYTDILTGLPNRAMFHKKLNNMVNNSKLNNQKFALMFLDLDRFKYVNDSMGHAAGDQLLQSISKSLQSALRSNDVVSRLGGDEFTILLPKITEDSQVVIIANRILEKLAESITISDKQIYVTVSIGISFYPNDGDSVEMLLKNSDSAMYKAKNQGRNQYVFYDNSIEEKNIKRKNSEDLLHTALENHNFIVYYQPQVEVKTNRIIGAEALVRVLTSSGDIIPPGEFIPLAEDLGLVGVIDLIVFEEVCKDLQKWKDLNIPDITISINISAIQLKRENVVEEYIKITDRYSINPELIQLELTEYSIIENETMALKTLQDFKKRGFSIALDDFGTGYSSLSSIQNYPLDTVKIDRSFITDSSKCNKSRSIVETVLFLAKKLNLSTVAEGVETEEQYNFIKSLDCHKIQGYYFYKPVSSEEMKDLLIKKTP